ncbi:MAG TPA: VWA domain-containing protein, partial [Candidatus Marinimicrobia bacterium]|nr:VWA domain-containing protein [Candidatus Neomarinimicrobiota bacterium]
MSKKIIINVALSLSCSFSQTVQIFAYPNKVEEGDVITLSVEAVGSESFAELDVSPIEKDFMIVSGPAQQTSYQWINGKATSSKTLTWTLVPNKKGQLTIPRLSGTIDGKPFTGEPIEILVDNSYQVLVEDSVFFITTELDKDEAFVGEQVTVTYKLYTRLQMSLEDIKYPESVGFWSEELSVPRPLRFNQTTINGVQYNAATLYKVALFPTKTGALELSPMTARYNVQVKTKRRQREIFDDPFFNFFNETDQKVFRTEPRTIRVKPYPVGQPANFTGAVGSFEISSYIDREFCKENEVFTFTIAMNGTGNGGMFNLPDVKFPEGIEVYPFKQNFEKDSLQSQLQFNQSWDYYLIPRRKGKLKILPVQMSYFDLESSSWKRTQTNPIELTILPADNSSVSREKRSGSSIKHKIKTRSYPLNDIIIALDISSSMLANDISPNRFEASKNTISNFLTGDINARIGLLAFAGESFIECPITYNHYVLRRIIENIDIAKKE